MDATIPTMLLVKSALVREGLRRILIDNGFPVTQECGEIEAFDMGRIAGPHIVIYDGSLLPADTDFAHLIGLKAMRPDFRIVLLAESFDFPLMNRAFAAGTHGYILRDVSFQSFLVMIQLVALGEKVAPTALIENLSDFAATAVAGAPDLAARYGLAEREEEILACLVMGMPNKLIARKIGVSEATVKLNIKGIFRKMAVRNRTQAAMMARFPMLPFEGGLSTDASR